MGPPGQDRRDTCKGSVTTTVVESLTGVSRKPAEARPSGIEPPGPEPVSRYMTSVPFVALIVCVPPFCSEPLQPVLPLPLPVQVVRC
jgi:hypothetical protein